MSSRKPPEVKAIEVCEVCGKTFEVSSKHRKFCSEECRYEAKKCRNPKYIPKKVKEAMAARRSPDALDKKLRNLNGMTYAEKQMAETLSMVPKIELPEWAKRKENQ